jgi:DnaJ like chaperone protein
VVHAYRRAAATIVGEGRRLWRCAAYRSTNGLERNYFRGAGRPPAHRSVTGAVVGALIGVLFDQSVGLGYSFPGSRPAASVSDVFFRTTFEIMGHVAKSDGRVSEAEIDAARRLMQEMRLGPNEIGAAIELFSRGKIAVVRCGFAHRAVARGVRFALRLAEPHSSSCSCARPSPATAFRRRHERILMRAAQRLGMSASGVCPHGGRGARAARGAKAGGRPQRPLSECYAELEVSAGASDQEVTKAYRRQMSRHHPGQARRQRAAGIDGAVGEGEDAAHPGVLRGNTCGARHALIKWRHGNHHRTVHSVRRFCPPRRGGERGARRRARIGFTST